MRKDAGLENSKVADSQYGLAIFVSTTARVTFRQANPSYAKVRNDMVNQIIAQSFSQSNPVGYFKTKVGGDEGVGEIRESGSSKFIAMIYGSHVSVIAVKKSPIVPAPVEAPSGNIATSSLRGSSRNFFIEHLIKVAEQHLDLDSSDMRALISYLKKIYRRPTKDIISMILKNKNKDGLDGFISKIHQMELGKEMVYDTLEPNGSFAIPQGEPINVDY